MTTPAPIARMTPEQSAAVARLREDAGSSVAGVAFVSRTDLGTLLAALDEAQADAARWRAVTTLKCNSLTLSRDDDHACNYVSASEWIDDHPEQFSAVSAEELQRMRDTNTIWALQVYPHTPIGSWVTYGATADAAIDAARAGEKP